MKIHWEVDDIKGGRLIQKPGTGVAGCWMICWRHKKFGEEDHKYGLVSLADGMLVDIGSGTKDAVAQHLDNAGFVPIELLDPLAGRVTMKGDIHG